VSGGTSLRYDHVAFDLDGTVVDSRADLAAAANHVLRSFGLPEIAPRSVYALVGEGARRLVERALGPGYATRVDEGVERFLDYYGTHLLDATVLYPGVAQALDALVDAGAALTVCSNKPEGYGRAILDGLGVASRFRAIVGGDSLATRKPDPAGMAALARVTGASRERTLLVGDSPVDVATAANAGVAFCGVAWGLDPDRLRAAHPRTIVDTPAELLAVVGARQAVRTGRVSRSS
jgi:phosphoglycolate phosphatase